MGWLGGVGWVGGWVGGWVPNATEGVVEVFVSIITESTPQSNTTQTHTRSKLINLASPGTVDERAVNVPKPQPRGQQQALSFYHKVETMKLCLICRPYDVVCCVLCVWALNLDARGEYMYALDTPTPLLSLSPPQPPNK